MVSLPVWFVGDKEAVFVCELALTELPDEQHALVLRPSNIEDLIDILLPYVGIEQASQETPSDPSDTSSSE